MDKIFCVEFHRVILKLHKKYLIHTISYNVEILRVRRFKISYAFSKRPWEPMLIRPASRGDISTLQIPLLFMSGMCNT